MSSTTTSRNPPYRKVKIPLNYVFFAVILAFAVGYTLLLQRFDKANFFGAIDDATIMTRNESDSNRNDASGASNIWTNGILPIDTTTSYLDDETLIKPNSVLLGQKIINKAFQQDGFSTLFLDICSKNTTNVMTWRDCLKKASDMSQNQSLPYSKVWPWWFQSMVRDAANVKNGLHGPWHEVQYYNVKPQTRQCIIEKVGTKNWQHLYMETQNCTNEKRLKFSQSPARFTPCYRNHSHLPESERFVFLRDPLARFLSGFLDKCVVRRHVEPHCEPLHLMANKTTSLVKDFWTNAKALFGVYVDVLPLKWNLHFFPQSFYCQGLGNQIHDYHLVGNIGERFESDLTRLANRYPQMEKHIELVFQLEKVKNKSVDSALSGTEGVETKAASRVTQLYTARTVKKVLEFFAVDYILLNLTIPEWAEAMLQEEENSLLGDK